jgi:hypothetical protein
MNPLTLAAITAANGWTGRGYAPGSSSTPCPMGSRPGGTAHTVATRSCRRAGAAYSPCCLPAAPCPARRAPIGATAWLVETLAAAGLAAFLARAGAAARYRPGPGDAGDAKPAVPIGLCLGHIGISAVVTATIASTLLAAGYVAVMLARRGHPPA